MKKIMFNDKYGLTKAVLDGRKRITRRIIADKKLNTIFMKDMEAYRKELSNARYDKRTTKKKHEPEYAYYSASTLNRIIRLVVAAVDE